MKSEEGRRRKRKHKKYNQIVNRRLGNCSPVTGKMKEGSWTSRRIRNAEEVIVKVGGWRRSKGVCVRELSSSFPVREPLSSSLVLLFTCPDLSPSLTG